MILTTTIFQKKKKKQALSSILVLSVTVSTRRLNLSYTTHPLLFSRTSDTREGRCKELNKLYLDAGNQRILESQKITNMFGAINPNLPYDSLHLAK